MPTNDIWQMGNVECIFILWFCLRANSFWEPWEPRLQPGWLYQLLLENGQQVWIQVWEFMLRFRVVEYWVKELLSLRWYFTANRSRSQWLWRRIFQFLSIHAQRMGGRTSSNNHLARANWMETFHSLATCRCSFWNHVVYEIHEIYWSKNLLRFLEECGSVHNINRHNPRLYPVLGNKGRIRVLVFQLAYKRLIKLGMERDTICL